MSTFRDYLDGTLLPEWAKNEEDRKLFHGSLGIIGDMVADMQMVAATAGLISTTTSPDDCLNLVGEERGGLWRYPTEDHDQYRARLQNAYEVWEYAGSGETVISQLALAGVPGVTFVFFNDRVGPHGEPAPYASQYWLAIPLTSCPPRVASIWGKVVWGFFDYNNSSWHGALPREFVDLVRNIVAKFGDPTCVFRGIELV